MFQGRPASYWIARIDDNAVSQENFKTKEGIAVLVRALDYRNSHLGRGYLSLWRRLPPSLRKNLVRPIDAEAVRRFVVGIFFYWCYVDKPIMEKEQLMPAVPGLLRALSDDNNSVRETAASALKEILFYYPDVAELVPGTVPALGERLRKDPDANIRYAAALMLALERTRARSAIPALKAALNDKDSRVQQCAKNALIVIDTQVVAKPEGK